MAPDRRHDRCTGFPGCNCISVNDEIVHGIPGDRVIAPGDVVKLDVTAECNGYIADGADTVLVPPVSAAVRRLRSSAIAAFRAGLDATAVGAFVNEIGRAVEKRARHDGFAVIRELCGHGVGRTIHEPPEVANYYVPSQRDLLTDGLVLTIEPLLAARRTRAVTQPGWLDDLHWQRLPVRALRAHPDCDAARARGRHTHCRLTPTLVIVSARRLGRAPASSRRSACGRAPRGCAPEFWSPQ